MSRTLRRGSVVCVLVALAWAGSALAAAPPRLSRTEQERVNRAIDAGASYLHKAQKPTGTWAPDKGHLVGHTALAALTLLECGASWEEESIQRAAAVVRESALTLDTTYELSLAILFLHRLGLPRDRPL